MTFQRPTLDELTIQTEREIETRLGLGPLLPRSVLSVLARVMGGLTHSSQGFVAWVVQQILPDSADGEFLERHASLRGLVRKPAQFARCTVDVTGTDGAVVPEGARFQRADGAAYLTTAQGTIADGAASVAAIAELPGTAANAPFGTLVTLTNPAAGVDGQAALGVVTGGEDQEEDAALRARVLEAWRRPPGAGTEADYERWALEVAGITRAFAYGRTPTLGQVTVYVAADGNEDGPAPTAAQLEGVRDLIETRRPVAARITVAAPTVTALAFSIELTPNTAAVRAEVELALADLLRREGRPGSTIRLSQIDEAISAAGGERWHRLTVPSADVAVAADEVLTVGAVTWS